MPDLRPTIQPDKPDIYGFCRPVLPGKCPMRKDLICIILLICFINHPPDMHRARRQFFL